MRNCLWKWASLEGLQIKEEQGLKVLKQKGVCGRQAGHLEGGEMKLKKDPEADQAVHFSPS